MRGLVIGVLFQLLSAKADYVGFELVCQLDDQSNVAVPAEIRTVLIPHFPYRPYMACRNQQQNYLM